jgi:hypothetical protein
VHLLIEEDVELNMVRCGVVKHPQAWEWVGSHGIMGKRQRYRLLDVERLCWRLGTGDLQEVRDHLAALLEQAITRGASEAVTALDGELGRGKRWIRGED